MNFTEEEYAKALGIVSVTEQASISLLQRRARVSYKKAAAMIDRMEAEKHIGPYQGTKPREVYIKPEEVKIPPKPKRERKKPTKPKKTTKQSTGVEDTQEPTEEPKKSRKGIGGQKDSWYTLEMDTKLDAVTGWTMQGATMVELAEMLGVSETTVYKWQKTRPQFAKALRAGRHVANGKLLNAAFKASAGHFVTKTIPVKVKTWKEFQVTDPKTGQTGSVIKQVEEIQYIQQDEYIQPNGNLLQFMLTNRLPNDYQRKENVHHTGVVGRFDAMTDEELEKALQQLEGEQ